MTTQVEVSERVEPGDVLVIDLERPGRMHRSHRMADAGVLGVVDEHATASATRIPVAVSGVVSCKVDAGYAEIRPGDLLTTSPTLGHAMKAHEHLPGTILGKALEPLEFGTGTIEILLMPR